MTQPGYSRVQGLNEAGDAQLRNLGATPVRGELTSLDGLRQQSAEADAVLHLAYIHDWGMEGFEECRYSLTCRNVLDGDLKYSLTCRKWLFLNL
jgi:hypothetical protein